MKRSKTAEAKTPTNVQVVIRGDVPAAAVASARVKTAALADRVREPVLFARVKLTQGRDPAVRRPAIAQANVDVNGRRARAQVAAETMQEAVDLLMDRLHERLARLNEHWEARRGGVPLPWPHEWRHGSEPTHRLGYYPRPAEEREVVRHKSFAVPWETPDEAAFELESMDYDFHLFIDAASGQDSVISRAGPTGYLLEQVNPRPLSGDPVAVPLVISGIPTPRLTLAEAEQRLDAAGLTFVFFADETTGRGNVLYHRYDGHYGLITPTEPSRRTAGKASLRK